MTSQRSKSSRVIVETPYHGDKITLETGWVAQLASGAVLAKQGETLVLVTVCRADPREGQDFFPLTVEYQEKFYAAGKIPGGFFKREGRPAEQEILTCRLIDRPIRPLFPEGYMDEVQLICTVLSVDGVNQPGGLALLGASAALTISEIPFLGPVASVRVGRVKGKLVINPSRADAEHSDMDFVVSGTRESIVMVEGGSKFAPEKDVLDALYFGHENLKPLLDMQDQLRTKVGKVKQTFVPKTIDETLVKRVRELAHSRLSEALRTAGKAERRSLLSAIQTETQETLLKDFPEQEKEISHCIENLSAEIVRRRIVDEKRRIDGRGLKDIRDIESEVAIIPRAHGSSLFTRGETQALVTTTLGSTSDAQRIDSVTDSSEKFFMLHYNFPPFSTGEAKGIRGTGRREIGHGALAERALRSVLPPNKDFPYVIRIVSDIMASNGSSSMASVCGGTLSLMDAGVPIQEMVAGIAMGLVKEEEKVAVLTDILGDEDHLGDMDFKVCGTKDGITALQMDIKCTGLSRQTMETALGDAKDARLFILSKMAECLNKPREKMSPYAPSIETMKINPDRIKDVIGPGGKMIRSITESTGVKIDISDDGTVSIFSADGESSKRARDIIMGLTEEAEIGKVYSGVVKKIMDFGAFVEILPGTEGLVHISQLSHTPVHRVSDVVKEGDEIVVRVLDIDRQGRIRLSSKEATSQN